MLNTLILALTAKGATSPDYSQQPLFRFVPRVPWPEEDPVGSKRCPGHTTIWPILNLLKINQFFFIFIFFKKTNAFFFSQFFLHYKLDTLSFIPTFINNKQTKFIKL